MNIDVCLEKRYENSEDQKIRAKDKRPNKNYEPNLIVLSQHPQPQILNLKSLYLAHLKNAQKSFDTEFLNRFWGFKLCFGEFSPKDYYIRDLIQSFDHTIDPTTEPPNKNSNPFSKNSLFRMHLQSNIESITLIKNLIQPDFWNLLSKKNFYPKDPKKRPLLLLDLDETLIHSSERNPESFDMQLTFEEDPGTKVILGLNFRPYLLKFLTCVQEFFELGIFTASTKDYATRIIEQIDPCRKIFSIVLFRQDCLHIKDNIYLKDLLIIGNRSPEEVFLVDNNSYFFYNQLENGIPIIPFLEDRNDTQLVHLLFFLVYLATLPSVDLRKELIRNQFKNFLLLENKSYQLIFDIMLL